MKPISTPAHEVKESEADEQKEHKTGEEANPQIDAQGNVKVPEDFQMKACALVDSCTTTACLDFLASEIASKRMKMDESAEGFSAEEEPAE
jgi:hypothetical protein